MALDQRSRPKSPKPRTWCLSAISLNGSDWIIQLPLTPAPWSTIITGSTFVRHVCGGQDLEFGDTGVVEHNHHE
jgi:hypothetical protein